MKVTIALALSLLALSSGNPFAGKEWHRKPRHPTLSTNPRSVPLDKFVKPENPLHFAKGTTKVAEIQPACLPAYSDIPLPTGTLVTIVGWGTGGIVDAPREVTVPVISQAGCEAVYGSSVVSNMMFCTDGTGGMGSCNGDSGGPVNYDTTGAGDWCVRRIVSFVASAGCEAGYPAGHTRVLSYLDWIETNTGIAINP